MPDDLTDALRRLRTDLLDPDRLVRAVAAGRRRGLPLPEPRRAELRPVRLRSGVRLQLVTSGDGAPVTANLVPGPAAEAAVDRLLAQPFGNWHVETTGRTVQLRVTKKGLAQVHVEERSAAPTGPGEHDRAPRHLLDPGDPLFTALGADAAKRRQVDAFLRQLEPVAGRAVRDPGRPLRVVDLGCGNAYLTFAAHRYLSGREDLPGVVTVGVEQRPELVERNTALAAATGLAGLRFVPGRIADAEVEPPDVVLALHACDTATDDALARAVGWGAAVVLAAPCCHHEVQRRLAAARAAGHRPPGADAELLRHPILRERFADVLTDTLRAGVLGRHGYRVEVTEFVASRHTPRNTLLRAVRGEGRPSDLEGLVDTWGVVPRLAELLGDPVAAVPVAG